MTYTPPSSSSIDSTVEEFTPPDHDSIDAVMERDPVGIPSNLTATFNGSSVDLTWSDNSSAETGFYIYRATSSGSTKNDYTQIDSVPEGTESYTDTTVKDGNKYYYRVTSHDN